MLQAALAAMIHNLIIYVVVEDFIPIVYGILRRKKVVAQNGLQNRMVESGLISYQVFVQDHMASKALALSPPVMLPSQLRVSTPS